MKLSERLLKLHLEGKTDKTMAKETSVSVEEVIAWRQAHGLLSNIQNVDNKILCKLYFEDKLTDKAIGEQLSINSRTVGRWRINNVLPQNPSERSQLFSALYGLGLSDYEITQVTGVSLSNPKQWRQKLNLPSLVTGVRDKEALELHAKGYNDIQLMNFFDASGANITQFRKAYSLEPNEEVFDEQEAFALVEDGFNHLEIASKLEVSLHVIKEWFMLHKLPIRTTHSSKYEEDILRLYKDGHYDAAIAKKLGIHQTLVSYVRDKEKLKPNQVEKLSFDEKRREILGFYGLRGEELNALCLHIDTVFND